MAEPTSTTVGVTTLSCVVGTSVCTVLAVFGLDVASLTAALLGCVAVQTVLPPENMNLKSIAMTTIGSMIFASFTAPWATPYLAKLAPAGVSQDHIRACAAALLAAFPKPVLMALQRRLQKILGATDA